MTAIRATGGDAGDEDAGGAAGAGGGASGRIAVVILTWNAAPTIAACLGALPPELRAGDIVVVADNASTDDTVAIVRRVAAWAELIENGGNLGFAAGNNRAIAPLSARGFEFVFVLNPDTVVQPGALAALRTAAAALPTAAVLQPLLLRTAGPTPIVDSLGLRPRCTFGADDDGHGTALSTAAALPTAIFGACAAAAFYRTAALRRAGLFDEQLFVLAEDLELAFRLRLHGGDARLVPAARVLHARGISGAQRDRGAARRRKHWLQRNTVALALRYWPRRWLGLAAPLLAWRMAQALWLAGENPGQPCWPLWRRYWRERGESRAAMIAHDVDRWFR